MKKFLPILPNVARGLVLIFMLTLLGLAVNEGKLGGTFNQTWIETYVQGSGFKGVSFFLIGATFFVTFGLPRQVVAFLGGYAFGLTLGATLALCATVSGCILAFFFSRFIGRQIVSKWLAPQIRHVNDFLKDNTFATTLLIRLLPLGSNVITNLVAGVTHARPSAFFSGSAIGYIPQTIIFSLLGSGIGIEPELRISLSILLFLLSALLGIYLYQSLRTSRMISSNFD